MNKYKLMFVTKMNTILTSKNNKYIDQNNKCHIKYF